MASKEKTSALPSPAEEASSYCEAVCQFGEALKPLWPQLMVLFVPLQQPGPEEDRAHHREPAAEDQQRQLLQLQHPQLPAQLPGRLPARLPGWLQRAQQSQR